MNYKELHKSLLNGLGVPESYGTISATDSKVEGQAFVVNFGVQKAVVDLHTLFAFEFYGKPVEWVIHRMGITSDIEKEAIEELYATQFLPVTIHSIPEGASSMFGIPFVVVETHGDFGWLAEFCTNFIYRNIWSAVVAATSAATYRDVMEVMAFETHSDRSAIGGLVRDMSSNDMSSPQTAAYTGAAHLVCFNATTNYEGLETARRNYDTAPETIDFADQAPQIDVTPDSAHEVLTRVMGDDRKVELVLDGSDPEIIRTITGYASMEHHGNDDARFSSVPEEDYRELSMNEIDGLLNRIWNNNPNTKTDKDYKILDKTIVQLVVKNCTHETQRILLARMHEMRFASCNLIYGVGANVYNRVDPSVFGLVAETSEDIHAPVKGKQGVESAVVTQEELHANDLLRVVYSAGEMKTIESLETIRERISRAYDDMFNAYFARIEAEKAKEEEAKLSKGQTMGELMDTDTDLK